ncbi:MAG TPA: hypothetical protein VMG10_30085 [Gemmataceae bacterium]|nr:hypothetical protein [Gemmataceae bacterium]
MTRLLRGVLVLLAVLTVGGLIDWRPATGLTCTAEAKPKGPKGPKKGKDHLQKAYEALTDVSAWTDTDRARTPRNLAALIDQAKDLYRDAVRAARNEEPRRADELAAAAHDAARGLVHALRAEAPAARGLPLPPQRDDEELDDLLRRTADRLEDSAEEAPRGAGRAFFDAARRLYDQARRAGRDDTDRALQLARAAEAWTHVGEHLSRADFRDVRRPEPERRRERPRPPRGPERDAPPPPPNE